MTYIPNAEEIERVRSLIQHSDLEGIHFHEVSCRRYGGSEEAELGDDSSADIGVQYRLSDEDFGIRLNARLRNPSGEASVSVSGEYALADGFEPSKRDVLLFANEVAVMTIFPYLREALSDATNRVFREPVLLPVAPRGAIAFDIEAEMAGEKQVEA
ncbi:hypothetical protein [Microbacterium aurum]